MTSEALEHREIVEGFSTVVAGYLAGSGSDPADHAVTTLGVKLAESGWISAANMAGEGLGDVEPLLVGLAEAAGNQSEPLPFPLLESWLSVQLLDACEKDHVSLICDIVTGKRLATLAPESLYGSAERSAGWGGVPYARESSIALAVEWRDARPRLVAVDSAWEDAAAVDLSMPVAKVGDPIGARDLGELEVDELERLACTYLLMQSAEMIGAARSLFDRTIAYLGQREQFGVTLDTFQALQHRAADMFSALETSTSLLQLATNTLVAGHDDRSEFAYTAKGFAGTECWTIANECLQLHGGLGYTWEAGLHQNLRRIAFRSGSAMDARRCLARAGAAAIARGTIVRA